MPLSESTEKLLIAELAGLPIAVFSNSYARLPEHFFARLSPTPVAKLRLIKFNDSLAAELGVGTRGLGPDDLAAVFAGSVIPSALSRSRWPMPGINSAISFRGLAMAARPSSARSWTATGSGAISN
jgi:hypothetical protein